MSLPYRLLSFIYGLVLQNIQGLQLSLLPMAWFCRILSCSLPLHMSSQYKSRVGWGNSTRQHLKTHLSRWEILRNQVKWTSLKVSSSPLLNETAWFHMVLMSPSSWKMTSCPYSCLFLGEKSALQCTSMPKTFSGLLFNRRSCRKDHGHVFTAAGPIAIQIINNAINKGHRL